MNPTFNVPNKPGPNTSQNSSTEAASAPNTPEKMNADTMRLGDNSGLGSWSRYQTTAVTGTRKLPSSTTVGRRIRLLV